MLGNGELGTGMVRMPPHTMLGGADGYVEFGRV